MANNGGRAACPEVNNKIVKVYIANGFKSATRENLYYRLLSKKRER
jgi:hypothetical protein